MNPLDLPEAASGCPLRAASEWLPDGENARCPLCGEPVREGQLVLVRGRCLMGGIVETGGRAALYSDLLEPEVEHVRCRAVRTGGEQPTCYTVGHGTRPAEELVELLRAHAVDLLVDVRTVPRSRHNPQFAADALAVTLREAGICYLHLKALGGLRKPKAGSPNGAWKNESFRGYADYMQTDAFAEALGELEDLIRLRGTAIMCAETLYWRCHRSLVADALLARGGQSLHLMGAGKAVPHRLTGFARVNGHQVTYPAPVE